MCDVLTTGETDWKILVIDVNDDKAKLINGTHCSMLCLCVCVCAYVHACVCTCVRHVVG